MISPAANMSEFPVPMKPLTRAHPLASSNDGGRQSAVFFCSGETKTKSVAISSVVSPLNSSFLVSFTLRTALLSAIISLFSTPVIIRMPLASCVARI